MKMLLTIHHYLGPDAGAPAVTLQLGQHYEQAGHQVSYFSFDNLPKHLPEGAKGVLFPEFTALHIARLTQQQALDVVETSTGDAWLWARWQQQRRNMPILAVQSHGLEHICHLDRLREAQRDHLHLSWKYPLYHGGFRLWEVAQSLRAADVAFTLNQQETNFVVDHFKLEKDRVQICPHGIPEVFFDLPLEPTPELGNSLGIALLGSYIPRKGIHYSVPALERVLKQHAHVTVSFLGTGCSPEQVYADFSPALCDRIQVIPKYSRYQLPSLLKGHHINLQPSLSEGFGLAIVEAMACGLAPVATAIQGPLDIIQAGQNGHLIPPGDEAAIRQVIEQLIADQHQLHQLRMAAQKAAQHYHWTEITQFRLQVYTEALAQKRRATQ